MGQFEELMHYILAHNSGFDPIYFTTQFLDGLKAEIRAGVALHRPQNLDSAFSLALLQEELVRRCRGVSTDGMIQRRQDPQRDQLQQ